MGTSLPPNRNPFLNSSAGQVLFRLRARYTTCSPSVLLRDSGTGTPHTTRRASSDTTSIRSDELDCIVRRLAENESYLSSSRGSSELRAPLGLRPAGALRAPSGRYSPTYGGVTRPGFVGPALPRASAAQYHQRTALPDSIPPWRPPTARYRRSLALLSSIEWDKGCWFEAPFLYFAVITIVVCH